MQKQKWESNQKNRGDSIAPRSLVNQRLLTEYTPQIRIYVPGSVGRGEGGSGDGGSGDGDGADIILTLESR
jgi:hypothetical protein